MATKNEDKIPAAVSPTQQSPEQTTTHSHLKSSQSVFLALLILLLVTTSAIACYALYLTLNTQHKIEQQSLSLDQSLGTLKQHQIKLAQDLDRSLQTVQQSEQNFEAQINALAQKLFSLAQQHLPLSENRLLLKAQYYLEMAQIEAHWSNHHQTTIALLQQANQVLANLHETRIFAIRQAIHEEIVQIQTLEKTDLPNILSQLDAIQNFLLRLPIHQAMPAPTQDEYHSTQPDEPSTPPTWRQKLKQNLQLLRQLVIIRHQDDHIQPFLTTAQMTMVREEIYLQLQQAQWAVLRSDQTVYQMALNQAIQSIQRRLNPDAHPTKEVLRQLNALQQIKLTDKKPSIEKSIKLLNEFIRSKSLLPLEEVSENHQQGVNE